MSDKKHHHAVVQVVAGLALNVFPAIFIAIYARIAPIDSQGFLALSLAVGVYVAQLLNAFIVEGRLATPDADHNLCIPRWIALLSIASATLLTIGPPVEHRAALMISSIGLMSGLLIARSIGVVSGRWKREAVAATVLIIAGLVALELARLHSGHCVRVLVLGAVAATLTRYWPRTKVRLGGIPPDIRRASWVTAETAVVGVVQPAITSVVLVMVGPAASVAFRVISTVSGALEPIIGYARYRLLAHGHKGEIAIVAVIFSAALAAVLGSAFGGLGSLIFGPAWSGVGVVAMLLACLWKGLTLLSAVPFAALRKAGETALVFWIRGASTLVYLGSGVVFLLTFHTITAIFLAFVLAEAFTTILYQYAATKGAPNYDVSLRKAARLPATAIARRVPKFGNKK
jgi:hypothetical protein